MTSIEKGATIMQLGFKIEMLLIKEKLLEIETNVIPQLITNEWNKKDRRVSTLINLSIEDSQIINVKKIKQLRKLPGTH